jgi:hypothetical protein
MLATDRNLEMTTLVAAWHPADETSPSPDAFVAHLHGRDLAVAWDLGRGSWRWRVATAHGALLAEGEAATRLAAQAAAEDEATAVHPPTADLVERLLT